MQGPGLFSDIGKKAKDVLTRDYSCDQKLTISTYSASGVARLKVIQNLEFRTIIPQKRRRQKYQDDDTIGADYHHYETYNWNEGLTSAAVKKGGLYSFDIGTQYKYKNTLVNVKVDTNSNVSTTLTMLEILPSTKTIASFKLPDYNSGKLEIQYFHHHASFTTAVALKQSPNVDLSGTVGAHGIAFGAEAGFDTASGSFTKYSAGISLGKPDYNASIILADKGDTLRASYVYHLDEMQKSAVVGEITRRFSTNENTFTVGGQYTLDPQTTVKSRLNNSGKLGALLQHKLKPKSILTISGEFDTKALDRTPKFGLGLALKP